MSVAKTTTKLPLAVAGALVLGGSAAHAAPFLTVDLLGRVQGSGLPFSSSVLVNPGDVVEYQVQIELAPEGTTNPNPTGTANDTITNWVPSNGATSPTSGLQALLFSLTQPADAGTIQADFDAGLAGTTTGGGTWGAGAGSQAGTVSARGNGNDNLTNVRLFRESGNFDGIGAGDVPEELVIATGTFDIASGGTASVLNVDLTGFTTGTFIATYRWRNAANTSDVNYLQTASQQSSSVTAGDPIIDFNGLTLTPVPEPTAAGLAAAVAGLGLLGRRRRRVH